MTQATKDQQVSARAALVAATIGGPAVVRRAAGLALASLSRDGVELQSAIDLLTGGGTNAEELEAIETIVNTLR